MDLPKKRITLLMLPVLGMFCSSRTAVCAAGEGVGTPGSGGGRWVVKVTADPDIVPLNGETVVALLHSDAVLSEIRPRWESRNGRLPSFHCEALTDEPQAGPLGRTVVMALDVNLPAADEFVTDLLLGLTLTLKQACDAHRRELSDCLKQARSERKAAEAAYRQAIEQATRTEEPILLDPADQAIYDQLQKQVDLSRLSPQTPFGEAIEVLKNSVDPPLPVVVLWQDLLDDGDVKPDDAINIDPPANVPLATGLQKVLQGVSGSCVELDYAVDSAVVTVATTDGLRTNGMETRVHKVPVVLRTMGTEQLVRTIQETIEPDSWFELSDMGEGTIAPSNGGNLIVWQSRSVHRKIQTLLREMAEDAPVTLPVEAPAETLEQQLHLSLAYRTELEKTLDQLQARLAEIERRRRELNERLIENSWEDISQELWTVVSDLQRIHEDLADTPRGEPLARVMRKVKDCLDKHADGTPAWRRPTGFSTMNWPFFSGNLEEQTVSKRIVATQNALRDVHARIGEIQRALLGQEDFSPQTQDIRLAARRLHRATTRVDDLQRRLAIVRAPSVTVLGAGD